MKSKIIEIKNGNYNKAAINEIVSAIVDKKIVIMPSDTIYGFLALPEVEITVREIKKRDNKPFLYLISSYPQLEKMGIYYEKNKHILNKYWPGPITFILSSKDRTTGLRMPDWDVLRSIVTRSKSPLISTSVNFSGFPAISDINEIVDTFRDLVDVVVIDDSFNNTIVSTIVDISKKPFKIIREGCVDFNENSK